MDKVAILIDLKQVEKVYHDAIETLPKFIHPLDLIGLNLKFGICFHINAKYPKSFHLMLNELKKDFLPNHKNFGDYWYVSPSFYFLTGQTFLIKTRALKPRLEHLQRTINRLENELKNQPTI